MDLDGSLVIQFSHFSVKEYLTSNRISQGRVSRYYIPLEPAHLLITRARLSFLELDKHVTKEVMKYFLLAECVGLYWADHTEVGNVSSHRSSNTLIPRIIICKLGVDIRYDVW